MKTQLTEVLHTLFINIDCGTLHSIKEHNNEAWRASANYGMNAQIDAQERTKQVILRAVDQMRLTVTDHEKVKSLTAEIKGNKSSVTSVEQLSKLVGSFIGCLSMWVFEGIYEAAEKHDEASCHGSLDDQNQASHELKEVVEKLLSEMKEFQINRIISSLED